MLVTVDLTSRRVDKWDNLKFFLIFFVVFGHILDVYAPISDACGQIRFFIYVFHMPLFLFISGLFSKKNIREKRYANIVSYLGLYFVIKLLIFISRWVADGKKPGFYMLSEGSAPWYAFALFVFSLITIALDKFKPSFVLVLSIIIGCAAGYDGSLGDKLCLSRIFVFYPFFFAGYMANEFEIRKFTQKKWVKLLAVLVIAAGAVIVYFFYNTLDNYRLLFTGRNSFFKVYGANVPYACLGRLACYFISALVGGAFIALAPESAPSFITKTGAKTLQIYALHMPLKFLYLGLLESKFALDTYFVGKLPLYSLIISAVLMIICALPFWTPLFNIITKPPRNLDYYKKKTKE